MEQTANVQSLALHREENQIQVNLAQDRLLSLSVSFCFRLSERLCCEKELGHSIICKRRAAPIRYFRRRTFEGGICDSRAFIFSTVLSGEEMSSPIPIRILKMR